MPIMIIIVCFIKIRKTLYSSYHIFISNLRQYLNLFLIHHKASNLLEVVLEEWRHESSMSISDFSNPICPWSACSHTNHVGLSGLTSFFGFLKLLLGLAVFSKI